MNNLSKDEFQSYRQYLTERLDAIEQALTGGGTFADELNDISNQLNAIVISLNNYYRKGEQMRIADLPDNVASKDYVNNRTKGILYGQVTAPPIIDEVVEARDGDVNLKTQIQRYSKKVHLITDINALTSGEIDNTRVEPPDHNDTTNRDAEGCHPIEAITDLTTELASKVEKTSVIEDINASEEIEEGPPEVPLLIDNTKVEPPAHNDTTARNKEGCHPISAISDLQETLTGLQNAINTLSEEITDAQDGYSSFQYLLECIRLFIQNINTHLQNLNIGYQDQTPPCWITY